MRDVVDSLQQTRATGLGTQGNESVVDRSFVDHVRKAGCEFHVWTINDAAAARRFVALGVDSITTDRPAFIRREVHLNKVVDEDASSSFRSAVCEGKYQHHLQGIGTDDDAIYWSFTTTLAKTDRKGKLLKKVPVVNHHGDMCYHDGRVYVAVNLGRFNDPQGNADSWVYVYDAESLKEVARHKTPEAIYGAGGIGFRGGHFFVVGGLPDAVERNYVYEYDADFAFLKKHVINSGHTHLGIQTATYADNRWWFGCYGAPKTLLVTDDEFRMEGRYEFDCSLGIAGISDGRLLAADGRCEKDQGCSGRVRVAVPDPRAGLRIVPAD